MEQDKINFVSMSFVYGVYLLINIKANKRKNLNRLRGLSLRVKLLRTLRMSTVGEHEGDKETRRGRTQMEGRTKKIL